MGSNNAISLSHTGNLIHKMEEKWQVTDKQISLKKDYFGQNSHLQNDHHEKNKLLTGYPLDNRQRSYRLLPRQMPHLASVQRNCQTISPCVSLGDFEDYNIEHGRICKPPSDTKQVFSGHTPVARASDPHVQHAANCDIINRVACTLIPGA